MAAWPHRLKDKALTAFAFVFPGQGSQSVGMLQDWAAAHPAVAATLEEANAALDFDLAALIGQGPAEALDQTINTQPAMLAADIAIWRVWQARGGPQPCVVAGHSLGEYAALVASGMLDFADALRLVRMRAQFMQEAVPVGQGAMAAVIGLDDAAVIALCEAQAEGQVREAVNFNAPGQVVVAGEASAVERLLANAKGAGARMARAIPVSVPAHSALMQPAAERLAEALRSIRFQAPRVPLLHNVDAQPATAEDARSQLARQVAAPVRWVESLQAMAQRYHIQAAYECGPGNVLCGLGKRSLKDIPFQPLGQPAALNQALEGLEHA